MSQRRQPTGYAGAKPDLISHVNTRPTLSDIYHQTLKIDEQECFIVTINNGRNAWLNEIVPQDNQSNLYDSSLYI